MRRMVFKCDSAHCCSEAGLYFISPLNKKNLKTGTGQPGKKNAVNVVNKSYSYSWPMCVNLDLCVAVHG